MARRPGQQRNYTHEEAQKKRDWFASASASVEGIADWDLKTEFVVEVITLALSQGIGIMFGSALGGLAVSITVYDGDEKHRKYVRDAIEFEDALGVIMSQLRPQLKAVQTGD